MARHAVWAYVALGSNLGDRVAHIEQACVAIAALPACSSLRCSPLYETAPMGPQDQPDYANAVCRFLCTLDGFALLGHLQAIERQHGRDHDAPRWSARPLDLDIVLLGDQSSTAAR